MVSIDAAQIVGWMDLNSDELGADMFAFGGHKGLQLPRALVGSHRQFREVKCATAQRRSPTGTPDHA